jgi:hypothetical protein
MRRARKWSEREVHRIAVREVHGAEAKEVYGVEAREVHWGKVWTEVRERGIWHWRVVAAYPNPNSSQR